MEKHSSAQVLCDQRSEIVALHKIRIIIPYLQWNKLKRKSLCPTKLNKQINAHSLMALDGHYCRDYGVKLGNNFPFYKVKFTCQALAMLAQLNDYDQHLWSKI